MLTQPQINKLIGERVRLARSRTVPKLSQSALGAVLGVSFQQVQKYERGVDRIAASRLVQIAQATGHDIPFFFEDALAACDQPAEQVAA